MAQIEIPMKIIDIFQNSLQVTSLNFFMQIKLFKSTVALALCCSFFLTCSAQDTSDKTWGFLIEPYLMIPYMKGSTGMGNLPDVSVDANAGDIFSHFQMAAMLYAEAYTDDWAIGNDIIYMNLKQDVERGRDIIDGFLHAKAVCVGGKWF